MSRNKSKAVRLSGDVMDHLETLAQDDDGNVDDILRRVFELPERPHRAIFERVDHGGRTRKYDVSRLGVGEQTAFPNHIDHRGRPNNTTIINAVRRYGKKTGREFHTQSTANSLVVYRTR